MTKRIGILYSGGPDSAALACTLLRKGYDVWPIYIRSGLIWEKQEIHFARKFMTAIRHPRLHKLEFAKLILENAYEKNWSKTGKTPGPRSRDEAVFLPARNLLLTVKAFLVLFPKNISHLAIATLRGNPFPDASHTFFSSLEPILSASFNRKIHIHTPFRGKSKKDVFILNRNCPIHLSSSCINPKGIYHCGKCNKCAERKKAFQQAGISDRTKYKVSGKIS